MNTDFELVKMLKEGKESAFNELFNAYSPRLYRFAYGYLKSKEEAEEMVQDIFSDIWRRRAEIKEEYHFSSYLFCIAFNYVKKYFRTKALMNKYILFASAETALQTENDVNYLFLKGMIDGLIAQMPEKRREVLTKSRFEGKDIEEISREMNISVRTVETHLHLALKFLRKHLNKNALVNVLLFTIY